MDTDHRDAALPLDARRTRLVALHCATVSHDAAALEELRRDAPPGEPDAAWREVVLMAQLFCGIPRTLAALEVLERFGGLGRPEPRELEVNSAPVGLEATGALEVTAINALRSGECGECGEALFATVYGEGALDVRRALTAYHPDLERHVIEHAYGRVLARPSLDLATRELCAVAALAILGHDRQLASHARGAVRCGAQPTEVHAALEIATRWVPAAQLAAMREVVRRFAR